MADDLIGARVSDENLERVGAVSALLPAEGAEGDRVSINFGGFLGVGETPVAVAKTLAELEQMANSAS